MQPFNPQKNTNPLAPHHPRIPATLLRQENSATHNAMIQSSPLRLLFRFPAIWAFPFAALSSCALVTVPVKVAGKITTTSIGLLGKAAGAGIDAMVSDDKDDDDPEEKDE